jgi:hypothetical protein
MYYAVDVVIETGRLAECTGKTSVTSQKLSNWRNHARRAASVRSYSKQVIAGRRWITATETGAPSRAVDSDPATSAEVSALTSTRQRSTRLEQPPKIGWSATGPIPEAKLEGE